MRRIRAMAFGAMTFIGAAVLASSCSRDEGGSDDVPNPALTLALKDSEGMGVTAGEVRVYARWQNPAKDSVPVLALPVSQGQAEIRDTVLLKAMQAATARGLAWPSRDTLAFNLVAKGPQGEAFFAGFLLLREPSGQYRFYRQVAGGLTVQDKQGYRMNEIMPKARTDVSGSIGAQAEGLGLTTVFIPGSPYATAIGANGRFTWSRMAKGTYALKALADDGKAFDAPNALDTEAPGGYQAEDWTEADLIWVVP